MEARHEIAPEIIVRVVTAECGRFTHHSLDDLASDLISGIWLKKREFGGDGHLRAYVREAIRRHWMNQVKAYFRRRLFSEMVGDGEDEEEWLANLGVVPAQQEYVVDAKRLKRFCMDWPFVHKRLFLLLADGASLLEAATEFGLPPWDAIRLLREIRQFVVNGHSLEPVALAA